MLGNLTRALQQRSAGLASVPAVKRGVSAKEQNGQHGGDFEMVHGEGRSGLGELNRQNTG